jgi:hypothetical protein
MKTTLFILVILFITFSCSQQKVKEKENVNSTDKDVFTTLDESYPALSSQIKKEAKDPYLLMFWGESLNFDSNAKKKIVDDKLIEELQALFNIKNDNHIVHAGIIHTYGYLLSTIETPYGSKAKRWTAPTLTNAFHLKTKALSPENSEGGMFSNATYFAGMIAFKNKTELSLLKNVSNEVFTYDFKKLEVDRIEEMLKEHTLVTTLVHFPHKSGDDNEYLLIYSVIDKQLAKELLITVFPINAEAYKKLMNKELFGEQKKITLRYNAHIQGLEQNLTGTRKLLKLK